MRIYLYLIAFSVLISCTNKATTENAQTESPGTLKTSTNEPVGDLSYRTLLNGVIEIKIPNNFIEVDDNLKNDLFNEGYVPDVAYYFDSTRVVLGITHSNVAGREDEMDIYLKAFDMQFARGAKLEFNEMKEFRGKNSVLADVVLNSEAMGDIYNKLLYTSIDGRVFMITFTCPNVQRAKYFPIAEEIFNSINYKR